MFRDHAPINLYSYTRQRKEMGGNAHLPRSCPAHCSIKEACVFLTSVKVLTPCYHFSRLTMKFFILTTLMLNTGLSMAHPALTEEVHRLGTELDESQLTSKPTIKLTGGLEDATITVGKSATFRCEVLSTPASAIQWKKDGEVVQGALSINIDEKMLNSGRRVVDSGIVASTYTIDCPTTDDAGVYTCEAFNGHKIVKSSAMIQVDGYSTPCRRNHRSAPKIIQWTDSRFEMEGNIATLSCRSDKRTEWAWSFDGQLLVDESRYEILPNGDLRIHAIEWDDMGTYVCIARNRYGETRQDTFLYPTAKKI